VVSVFLMIPVAPVLPGFFVAAVLPFAPAFLPAPAFPFDIFFSIVSPFAGSGLADSKNQHYFGIFPRFPPIIGISRRFALFLHPFCEQADPSPDTAANPLPDHVKKYRFATMAGQLKEVRNRIKSIQNTQQITKAMKMVSAAKLRRAQDSILQMRPYAQKLQEMLSNIVSNSEGGGGMALATERPVEKVLLIVITSDR